MVGQGVLAMETIDTVVVGAGVVGLAVARALAGQGADVLVLECATAIGTGISARSSEVIHAGIYYASGSLKARLCVAGRQQLDAYCQARHIGHARIGKLIVATAPDQMGDLARLAEQARRNGVHDLQVLSASEARAMEPALVCHAALWSPSTGIVDSHALMLSLQADLEHAGGLVALQSALASAQGGGPVSHPHVLTMADGTELACRQWVNAAGLQALPLARRAAGLAHVSLPEAAYAKGHYFTLSGRAPFERLIYPIPEAAGLGVHLTLDLGGQARFGPDVEWVDSPEDFQVDMARATGFASSIRSYWPGLPDGALQPAYAGIRPKLLQGGQPLQDFLILGPAEHGVAGMVHLLGIESPGLTSSLALAEEVLHRLG